MSAEGFNVTVADDEGGGTSQVAALVIAIAQTVILVVMGPTVLFYGPAVHKSVIFMQALFAANYIAFAGAFAAVDAFTAFDVWDKFVVMATATLTLTFTAIKSQKARAISQGAVLGALIATPLTEFMRTTMWINYAGCTGFGEKTPIFPDGTPTGCELHGVPFQVSFQCSKLVFWIITASCAAIGKKVTNVSVAMTGSTMIMKGTLDLVKRICIMVMPESAATILGIITPVRTFVGYGLTGVGVFVQLNILKKVTMKVDGKPVERFTLKSPEDVKVPVIGCFVSPTMKCLITPLNWFDKFLTMRMEGAAFVPTTDNVTEALTKAAEDKAREKVAEAKKKAVEAASKTVGADLKGVADSLEQGAMAEVTAATDSEDIKLEDKKTDVTA